MKRDAMPRRCIAVLALFAWTLLFVNAADKLPAAPAFSSNLPLRTAVAPSLQLEAGPLAEIPQFRVQPLAPVIPLAEAQLGIIRDDKAWRNWAALAIARYKAGDYEKSYAAVRQMRSAAAARSEPLPLAADELFTRCRRAAEALTLLE